MVTGSSQLGARGAIEGGDTEAAAMLLAVIAASEVREECATARVR